MLRRTLAALALCTLFAAPAMAEPQTYTFDKLHTQIHFRVDHMGFSHSVGKFLGFDGSFTFDEAAPEGSTVNVSIDTKSINMDDAKWEEHLKGKDFFNVEQFPAMTFKSTKLDVTRADKKAVLTGDLTLLGVTKPVTLDVTFNKCGEHPMSKLPTCGFDAATTIKRSEWGMGYGVPMVGDDVAISITVEASAQPAAPAAQ